MTATLDPARVYTVAEAAAILGVGTRTYYSAAARGEVPARHVGRRLVVPGAALERFLMRDSPREVIDMADNGPGKGTGPRRD